MGSSGAFLKQLEGARNLEVGRIELAMDDGTPHFPGSNRLREWGRELHQACDRAGADADQWMLTGHAVMVVGEDTAACTAALRRVAVDAGMGFVDLLGDGTFELPAMAVLREAAPVLVYLQSDPFLLDPDQVQEAERREILRTFHARLTEWVRDFDPARPVVVATSASEITDIAADLRSAGLFDRFFRLPPLTMETYGRDFVERVGRPHCGESVMKSLAKVGMLFHSAFATERRKQLALLRLRRLIARERRPLEFADLVNLSLRGFAEEDARPEDPAEIRRQTAYHEAGHAAVAVIDSNGQNIPEYSSIVPSVSFEGVVVTSLDYQLEHGTSETYEEMRHDVRVSLAGRAAEEVVFGATRVSNGAASDLRNAVLHAGASFAFWGFAPSMEKAGQACSNLMIAGIDDDDFSPSEQAHIETLVRTFLATEYEAVKAVIVAHRPLVDDVAERLMHDAVVDQATLACIVRSHQVQTASRQQSTPSVT